MKSSIKFILSYYGISILLLFLSNVVGLIKAEIAAYLLWFYIFNTIIGLVVFPLAMWCVQKIDIARVWKFIVCFFVLIVLLNVPYLVEDGTILTIDLIKGICKGEHSSIGFNNGGIHLVAIFSFIICCFLFRSKFLVMRHQMLA